MVGGPECASAPALSRPMLEQCRRQVASRGDYQPDSNHPPSTRRARADSLGPKNINPQRSVARRITESRIRKAGAAAGNALAGAHTAGNASAQLRGARGEFAGSMVRQQRLERPMVGASNAN